MATSRPDTFTVFKAPGRGGLGLHPEKTAVLFIEFQNEFTTPGGKLHPQVKEVMAATGMLEKSASLAKEARRLGLTVMFAPISFAADGSDNPNKNLGILAGCDGDRLFVRGTWNAEICEAMRPEEGDLVVSGKRGLSAFPNTDLERLLRDRQVETLALAGFMANCCVESTMREACERGFNVITLTDCVATTSVAGQKAAVEITYPFFSTPMNAESFLCNVRQAMAPQPQKRPSDGDEPAKVRARRDLPPPPWMARKLADGVLSIGPWFADVRHGVQGQDVVLRSGEHELTRYLTFAEACGPRKFGLHLGKGCELCDTIYSKRLPAYTGTDPRATEAFGWLCNMAAVRLEDGGCLLYSPVLDENDSIDGVVDVLGSHDFLPVRVVIAPSPQHHLTLGVYQKRFPDALYVCGQASGQMQPLTKKRRDLKFDALVAADGEGKAVIKPVNEADRDKIDQIHTALANCKLGIVDDNRTGEIVLCHLPTGTLILSDLLYKSNANVLGPGGSDKMYTRPKWFADGQEELFYGYPGDCSSGLLPSYRTHPRMRTINVAGMRRSLEIIKSWSFQRAFACHTDVIEGGEEVKRLLQDAWGWVFEGQP